MIAVEVTAGDRMTASRPRELFSGSYMATANKLDYDVAADGRFVMIKTPDEDWPREIDVVLNWFQELESLSPLLEVETEAAWHRVIAATDPQSSTRSTLRRTNPIHARETRSRSGNQEGGKE